MHIVENGMWWYMAQCWRSAQGGRGAHSRAICPIREGSKGDTQGQGFGEHRYAIVSTARRIRESSYGSPTYPREIDGWLAPNTKPIGFMCPPTDLMWFALWRTVSCSCGAKCHLMWRWELIYFTSPNGPSWNYVLKDNPHKNLIKHFMTSPALFWELIKYCPNKL